MRSIFYYLALLFFPIIVNGQLDYEEINDLTTLCKKEDFQAVKTFLQTKKYELETLNINYDHGSYLVLCDINALNSSDLFFTNKIHILYQEFDSYKELSISQSLATDHKKILSLYRVRPFWSWANEKWTTVLVPKNSKNSEQTLGKSNYYFDITDTTLQPVDRSQQISLFKTFNKNEDGYECYLVNSNPKLGDIKYNILTYHSYSGWYDFSLLMKKKYFKGQNVTNRLNKNLEIPLIRNGKIYSLNLKFGKLTKKYILDSGASDMSIDKETYEYFESSGQLRTENHLSDSKYQLADGSIIQLERIRVPIFSISDFEIKNIDATVIANGKPLLLGKSFLDSFKSWKIDNERQVLEVELF